MQCLRQLKAFQINRFQSLSTQVAKHISQYSCPCSYQLSVRYKHSLNSGIKGIQKNKKAFYDKLIKTNETNSEEVDGELDLDNDRDYEYLANNLMHVSKNILNVEHVYIIQPYIKWGPKKSNTKPELQLEEAEALVRSIPTWKIVESVKVPLESLDKKTLFGSGKLNELADTIKALSNVTSVFVSKGTLSLIQKHYLEERFGIPVIDRYSVVIQILRLHATSMEAKLQVAMAEIPYIWSQMRESEGKMTRTKFVGSLTDTQKQMLRARESKLKNELVAVRSHRELLRNKRRQKNFPVIAVVGYTNAGKTSLIKAITEEESLKPKNQLFATLDVTAHAGLLPCNLNVIYMDTVGFMADIPTGLIECFVATLEDAMLADVVIHVQDMSHENYLEQKKHVEETLKSLLVNTSSGNHQELLNNVINVGNKIDLFNEKIENADDLLLVSSKTGSGIGNLLDVIEERVLAATGRFKMIFKVPAGGIESSWLYKNAAVTEVTGDPDNSQQMLVNCVISKSSLEQFKHIFLNKSK